MADKSLRDLQASESIRRLLALYSDAVCRRQPGDVASLFTPDAQVVIMDAAPRIGRDAIVEGLTQTIARFSYLHQTFGAGLIDVAGDVAHGRISIMEITRPVDGETLNAVFGQYEDLYRHDGTRWYFDRRRFFLSYMAQVPATEVAPFAGLTPQHSFAP